MVNKISSYPFIALLDKVIHVGANCKQCLYLRESLPGQSVSSLCFRNVYREHGDRSAEYCQLFWGCVENCASCKWASLDLGDYICSSRQINMGKSPKFGKGGVGLDPNKFKRESEKAG